MANWTQGLAPPAGALPGNLVTKAGVGVIAVLLVGLVLSQSGGDPETDEVAASDPGVVGQGVVGQIRSRLTQLEEQRRVEADRRARTAAAAAPPPGLATAAERPIGAARPDEGPGLQTAGEVELREAAPARGAGAAHAVATRPEHRADGPKRRGSRDA